MTGRIDPQERRTELVRSLAQVRARIAAAAESAGRRPGDITLIAVTKFFPASDVRHLVALGVTDVGENRHQEAEAKAADCADLDGLRWHYIGALQSNKAAAVARYADVVQSVDRLKLLTGLERGAAECGHHRDVMVQVCLDRPGGPTDPGRAGALPSQALQLADAIAATEYLNLVGVMAVAPVHEDRARAFERLAKFAAEVRESHPQARAISAGMSGDLEEAVQFGATHVRIGSAILGNRPSVL